MSLPVEIGFSRYELVKVNLVTLRCEPKLIIFSSIIPRNPSRIQNERIIVARLIPTEAIPILYIVLEKVLAAGLLILFDMK
jgi:hypothetical protein